LAERRVSVNCSTVVVGDPEIVAEELVLAEVAGAVSELEMDMPDAACERAWRETVAVPEFAVDVAAGAGSLSVAGTGVAGAGSVFPVDVEMDSWMSPSKMLPTWSAGL
jgi:hypothetical protein